MSKAASRTLKTVRKWPVYRIELRPAMYSRWIELRGGARGDWVFYARRDYVR